MHLQRALRLLGWVCLVRGAPRASGPGGQRGEPWLLQAPAAGRWGPETVATGPQTPTPTQGTSKKAQPLFRAEFSVAACAGLQSSTRGWAWCFLDGTLSQGAVTGLGNKQFLHETREGACPQLTLTWCSCPTSPPWFPVSHFCWLAASRKCIQTAACRKSICYVTFHLTCTSLTGKSAGGHFITDTFNASLPYGLEDIPMQ